VAKSRRKSLLYGLFWQLDFRRSASPARLNRLIATEEAFWCYRLLEKILMPLTAFDDTQGPR
jgi:hypothetical protein